MYPPVGRIYGGFELYGTWTEGGSNWTMDYPRSDRHLSQAVRRLTRIHARSAEQSVNLDDGDAYDWPFLYGVEVGPLEPDRRAGRGDARVSAARRLLHVRRFPRADRMGRLHGKHAEGVSRSPDRGHCRTATRSFTPSTIWTIGTRCPARCFWRRGRTYEKGETGKVPHWRGIYDDHGRLMVAICHNMDLGDSWEHADNPEYPEKYSALGIRIALNYIIYSMTH